MYYTYALKYMNSCVKFYIMGIVDIQYILHGIKVYACI
jgi:hypothetical protein